MWELIVTQLLGVFGWFASGWYGARKGHEKALEMAKAQKAESDAEARDAYLRHLKEEMAANRRILWEAKTYLNGGPPILEILDPTNAAMRHLRFRAWSALVEAGVLAGLDRRDQALFRVADRTGRKAAQETETLHALWHRSLSWDAWMQEQQRKGELVQRFSQQGLLQQFQRQLTESLGYAVERTDQALKRLNELTPEDSDSPAS